MKNYQEKQEAKRERFERLAEKNEAKNSEHWERSSKATEGMPFGQPILVGHHSEGRHRAAIARAHREADRALEASKKAKYYAEKANSVGTGGISSDDETAIEQLKAKIEKQKKMLEQCKSINKMIRKKATAEEIAKAFNFQLETAQNLLKEDYMGNIGIRSYSLTSYRNKIKSAEKRLLVLEKMASVETKKQEFAGFQIVENAEENRYQVLFDDIPSPEIRTYLKRNGFRWSPKAKAWQRMLSSLPRSIREGLSAELEAAL
jgi:hypothetical protein